MLLLAFARGLLLGISIAAPVGPIGLLCIRRTLDQGRQIGFVSGCGAATADAFYGTIAAFGLAALSDQLVERAFYLQLLGGLFLCYLGLKAFFARPAAQASELSAPYSPSISVSTLRASRVKSSLSAYGSTLVLTLSNPATIFMFLSIFAGFSITQGDYLQSVTLVFGVFSGSLLWWLVLVSGVGYLRSQLTPARLNRFNRLSSKAVGLVLMGFGLAALVSLLPT